MDLLKSLHNGSKNDAIQTVVLFTSNGLMKEVTSGIYKWTGVFLDEK